MEIKTIQLVFNKDNLKHGGDCSTCLKNNGASCEYCLYEEAVASSNRSTIRVDLTLAYLRTEGLCGVFKQLENTSAWRAHIESAESSEALGIIQDWMARTLSQSAIDDITSRLRETELQLDEVARQAEGTCPLQAEQEFEHRYFSDAAVCADQWQERLWRFRREY